MTENGSRYFKNTVCYGKRKKKAPELSIKAMKRFGEKGKRKGQDKCDTGDKK